MISEARTDLSNIEANFGGNIELDVSWTLLAYATFSTKLIFTAPYKDRQEIYRYELPDLESRIHNRIVITKKLLSDIASPVQSTVQEHIYRECLKRIEELTTQATQDLQDIRTKHEIKNSIDKIKHFQVNLGIIKHRTHSTYTDLCTWEAQTKNQNKGKDALSKEKETNNNLEETNKPPQVSPTKNLNLDTAVTFGREPPGQTPPQDHNISRLEAAKTRICNSINKARDILARMTTATLHTVLISTHVGDIIKMTHQT